MLTPGTEIPLNTPLPRSARPKRRFGPAGGIERPPRQAGDDGGAARRAHKPKRDRGSVAPSCKTVGTHTVRTHPQLPTCGCLRCADRAQSRRQSLRGSQEQAWTTATTRSAHLASLGKPAALRMERGLLAADACRYGGCCRPTSGFCRNPFSDLATSAHARKLCGCCGWLGRSI